MLHILIIAHSYIAGSHRHVLLLAHKRPLSLTATGEFGGHGQWNPRQLLVRSAQNWAFCSVFTSPLSLLTVVARFSAPAFTIAVTLWHFSSFPCMWSYRWTSCFPEQRGKTHCLTVQFLIFSEAHVHLLESVLRLHTSACYFMKDDQMTRWAVINELLTEHFTPSGKRVPRQTRSASGHQGRGTAVQSALCLCQPPPKDCCMGPAHLNNIRLLRAFHLSVLSLEKH